MCEPSQVPWGTCESSCIKIVDKLLMFLQVSVKTLYLTLVPNYGDSLQKSLNSLPGSIQTFYSKFYECSYVGYKQFLWFKVHPE